MTLSEAVKSWLYTNEQIALDERITTELLGAEAIAYSLSKTPSSIRSDFIDGGYMGIEYYQFFMRQATQLESERVSNDRFLEQFEEWVDENKEYPILDGGRFIDDISVSSGFYLFETQEEESIYTFTLEVVYRKEK